MVLTKNQQIGKEKIALGPYGLGSRTFESHRLRITKEVRLWEERLEFWEQEFAQLLRIVQLQLNGKQKKSQAISQNYIPLKTAIKEELPGLMVALNIMERKLNTQQSGPAIVARTIEQRWQKLEQQLISFERELRGKKKRFLAMLYYTLPLKIV